MRDGFDRPIHYLRVSVTDRCNLRCEYCAPPESEDRRLKGELLSLDSIARIARAAVGLGVEKLRLTGGEPLLRDGIVGLVGRLSKIPGLKTLAMTTNGTRLAAAAADLRAAGLDSVNVSLDTLDGGRYERMTRGGSLAEVLAGIDAALGAGLPVKLNIVLAEGDSRAEEEACAVERYGRERGASSQRIRRYDLRETKVYDPRFDRPPRCEACDRIRLLADGRLMPCLHSDLALPLDLERIEESLKACIGRKPERGEACTTLRIGQIGG